MSGTPRCCNTLRSTPLGNLDPVIRLFEGIFLTASANLIRNRGFHVDYLGHAHFRGEGMLSVGGLTLYPIHYRAAFASSPIPSPLSHWLPLQEAYPRGETTGFLRSSFRSLRVEVVPLGRWCTIRDGGIRSPRT